MSIFYKNKDGEIRKIATNLTQRINARWFLCTRAMEDGQEYYDVPEDQTLNYFTSISPFTIYAFGFNEPNTTRTPKLRYKGITYDIADVTSIQAKDLGIGQLQGVFQMFTQESETDRTIYFVGDMHQDYQRPNEDVSRVIEIGLDGIIESGKVNFTVKDSEAFDPFKTNLREFLMSAHLPIVLANIEDLDTTMEVVITFGDTVYYMYNYLTGADVRLTIGDLLSVASYDQTTGFYFHFKSVFFETSELVGFAIIPPAITAKQLEQLIEDNDSIITELNSDGDRLSIHLSADIVSKLTRMLVTPMSRPISTELVAIDNTGTQTMLELGDGLIIEDGKLKATAQGGGGGGADIKVDDALSETSENPVQNKVITSYLTHVGLGVGQIQEDVERLKQQVNFVNKIFINMANITSLAGVCTFTIVSSSNFVVDWGDGTTTEYVDAVTEITHTYSDASFAGWVYIYGDWKGIIFGSASNTNKSTIIKIEYDNSVTSIGQSAFYYCSGLKSITIPNSVTNIGNYAFYQCRGLINVVIPDSVRSISAYAFQNCVELKSVTIPSSVIGLEPSAFANCISLISITIPEGVQGIGVNAFQSCSKLASITMPSTITRIDERAFYNCSKLTSITIPDSVKSIGIYVFQNCTGLTSVTIGNGVTSIGTNAFYGCSNLTSITINATTPPTLSNTDTILSNVTQIFVPYSSLQSYKTATNWSTHADKIYPKGGNYSETITIPASSWDTSTNTVTVEAVGATSEARNIISWNVSSSGVPVENTYGLKCTAQGTMQLTFSCETIPTEDVEVSVRYMLTNY